MFVLLDNIFTALFSFFLFTGANSHFNPFMDNVYFSIDWGSVDENMRPADLVDKLPSDDSSSVIVTSSNQEKYRCILPNESDVSTKSKDEGQGIAHTFELDLLKPLFDQKVCTYRLETYWTYELCHGKHLRQYHEEKELGKKTRLTEYFLGRYKPEKFLKDYAQAKEEYTKNFGNKKKSFKRKKVQGIEIPYYEVVYDDGTVCDLTGEPRRTTVHYVCQPDGRGEVYELKETSSCEYEVIVLTALLCPHDAYGLKKEHVNTIQCHFLDGSPQRPVNLDLLEDNQRQYNSKQFWSMDSSINKKLKDEEDEEEDEVNTEPAKEQKPTRPSILDINKSSQIGKSTDKQLLLEFLAGDFCIHGGTGWWKYEFCYGKHVLQYHQENADRVVVVLGEWNTASHLLWISNNPKKRPVSREHRKVIRHYYANGDFCEANNKNRVSEIKLRCIENPSLQHSMSIYVLEPNTCEYQVVVESPLLCSIISQSDDNGLILEPKL